MWHAWLVLELVSGGRGPKAAGYLGGGGQRERLWGPTDGQGSAPAGKTVHRSQRTFLPAPSVAVMPDESHQGVLVG